MKIYSILLAAFLGAFSPLIAQADFSLVSMQGEAFPVSTSKGVLSCVSLVLLAPGKEQTVKSPVDFKIGFECLSKGRATTKESAPPLSGELTLKINVVKPGAQFFDPSVPTQFIKLGTGKNEISVPLKPGRYFIQQAFDPKPAPMPSGQVSTFTIINVTN
jgi:hypothetical protein